MLLFIKQLTIVFKELFSCFIFRISTVVYATIIQNMVLKNANNKNKNKYIYFKKYVSFICIIIY